MERQFALWLGRRLPNFIRAPLSAAFSYFYGLQGKVIIWNNELIEALGEFYGMDSVNTRDMMRNAGKLIEDAWKQAKPKSEEDEVELYKSLQYYPFQLAYWHSCLAQRRFRKWVVKQAKGSVLDYGGGIGDLSLTLWRNGQEVTYLDISTSHTARFARYLFEKHKANIKIILLDYKSQVPQLETYDTIISLDVIEHIPDAKQTIKTFYNHLAENGRLIATNVYYNPKSSRGDHRPTGITRSFMKEIGFKEMNGLMWVREQAKDP